VFVSLETRFAGRMGTLLGPDFPSDIALAVSGGGDSMAMLTLAHNWTRVWGVRLWVVTVDHGLREEARDEADMVARVCKELGHPHAILRWHWDGAGNLQAAARMARLQLIDRWRMGLEVVLMAHTADDVAEGFLMRLARGSGVEGLSAMSDSSWVTPHKEIPKRQLTAEEVTQTCAPPLPHRRVAGVPAYSSGFRLIRPLLQERREDLRHYLRVLKGTWAEDPSNTDPRFERVRWRQAMPDLAFLGLDVPRLAGTATTLARASEALEARAADVTDRIMTPLTGSGEIVMDRKALAGVEEETQLRLLARALQWVSQADHRPRIAPLEKLLDRVLSGGGGTLHGCEVRIYGDHLRMWREYGAVKNITAQPGDMWDRRFRLTGPGTEVRALGDDGWSQLPKGNRNVPYHAARSLPALFDQEVLVSCPSIGHLTGGRCQFNGKLPLFKQSFAHSSRSMRRRLGESD
jgi:tRNA(Ile)-lysidine synthase